VLDDDALVLRSLEATLKRHFRVHTAASGEAALELLADHPEIGVAVVDQRMPGMSGPEFIRRTVEPHPNLVRIILTGYQDIESLKQAINNGGAYRYLEKPCPNEELIGAVRGAAEVHRRLLDSNERPAVLAAANDALRGTNVRLQLENLQLRLDAESPLQSGTRIVGQSPALRRVIEAAERVAATDTSVLILGETGTGKDMLARHVHECSPRRAQTFRAQNCSAVVEQLIEDTLFGHVPGAFTGAKNLKKGLFEIADRGTLFLDEIGDSSASLQARLLRVLEERVIYRVGDDERAVPVDVRLITATNRDLQADVESGRFRRDLYFRLNVLVLHMPPLRERREDIAPLASHFLACLNERARSSTGKVVAGFEPAALAALESRPFPGNVRELANAIERAWLFADDEGLLSAEHLQPDARSHTAGARADPGWLNDASGGASLKDALQSFKIEFVTRALERNHWNVAATARELGINRASLYADLRQYGLRRPD